MLGLWVLTRVEDHKRQELIQSLSAFIPEPSMRPSRRFILEDVNDESLVAWLGYWRSDGELDEFLASPTFQAMKGAADTLGHLEEVRQLNGRLLHPIETSRP